MFDAAVIGGGISGLACAYDLKLKGFCFCTILNVYIDIFNTSIF